MAEETETKQLFSPSDVSLHASRKDCWVVIHGKVYDVTKFLEDHPGGEDVLLHASGDVVMEVQRAKPTINHRFSTLRFMRVVNQLNPIQRGYITNRNMDYLLKLPKHLMVPVSLLQWLVDYTVPRSGGVFKKKNKIIHFTKNIADKVFGFESDTFRYALSSNDPDVVSEVEAIRLQYVKGDEVPINHLEGILLGTNDEVNSLGVSQRAFDNQNPYWIIVGTVSVFGTMLTCTIIKLWQQNSYENALD